MKNKAVKIVSITIIAILLSSCDKKESKLNQSNKIQIQKEDASLNQADNAVNSGNTNDLGVASELISNELLSNELSDELTDFENKKETVNSEDGIDVDLTKLSSTMVYSEVYNMMYSPKDYIGKTVKMSGMFVAYTNQDESQFYPAVIIADATACCSQGLEFVLEGNPPYPEGYPETETEITVIGTFETYLEDGNTYCRLQNAKIE